MMNALSGREWMIMSFFLKACCAPLSGVHPMYLHYFSSSIRRREVFSQEWCLARALRHRFARANVNVRVMCTHIDRSMHMHMVYHICII